MIMVLISIGLRMLNGFLIGGDKIMSNFYKDCEEYKELVEKLKEIDRHDLIALLIAVVSKAWLCGFNRAKKVILNVK